MDHGRGEKSFRSFDGTPIRYHDTGSGDGMLFAGGFLGSVAALTHVVAFFEDRFRILSWDYRGLFGSAVPADGSRLSVDDHARDALAMLDRLEVASCVLFCWSMGVQVGLEVYRRRPGAIRALVLVCGTYGRPFETAFNWKGSGLLLPAAARAFSRIPAGAFWIGRSRGVHPRFFGWARRAGLVAGCIDEDLFSRLLSEFGDQDIRVYTTLLRELGEHDATDVLVDVSVPTLIVAGEADHFTPRRVAEKMARRIRGAEMTMVPGGTHFVPLEQPELVNLRTEKFLCDHEVLDPGSRARPRPMRADADPAA